MGVSKLGRCKLTGQTGRLVKSHILPRALTDLALDKNARIQYGGGDERPQLRHTSWYDSDMVAEAGERKLAAIDDAAIKEIARLGLSWRHFPLNKKLAERLDIVGSDFEIIRFENADQYALQLFFLSVLWRASFSRRREFKDIRLDVLSRNKLTKIVNGEVKPQPSDFPCVLLIHTSKGPPQVDTPRRDRMAVPELVPGIRPYEKIFRFFLDGLVVHMGRKAGDQRLYKNWKPRCVGVAKGLILIGRPYKGSRQMEMIDGLQDELEAKWPDQAQRIFESIERST